MVIIRFLNQLELFYRTQVFKPNCNLYFIKTTSLDYTLNNDLRMQLHMLRIFLQKHIHIAIKLMFYGKKWGYFDNQLYNQFLVLHE